MEQSIFLLEILFFSFLAFVVIYTLILSVSGWVGYKSEIHKSQTDNNLINRIAILIPAYKEDSVIEKVSQEMNQLVYPKSAYDIYVIADSMKESTIERIKELVNVINVSFKKSTKSKSINYAFAQIKKNYDLVVISDGDNILEESFLTKINNSFNSGAIAIQGHRIAKNTNTKMAILDAASEEINNHIYRRGLNGLGLSSAIIGSGMAFEYNLLKDLMLRNEAVGGFDKILQLAVIEKGIDIKYLHEAIVFDEKIENVKSFQNQRKRWISSQIKYLGSNFFKGWKQLFRGNFDYFNIAVICGIMPPRIIVLGVLFTLSSILLFFPQLSQIGSIYWLGLTILYITTLILSIPKMFLHPSFLLALLHLPVAFANILLVLFNLKKADEKFIHTKHSNSTISNVFRK